MGLHKVWNSSSFVYHLESLGRCKKSLQRETLVYFYDWLIPSNCGKKNLFKIPISLTNLCPKHDGFRSEMNFCKNWEKKSFKKFTVAFPWRFFLAKNNLAKKKVSLVFNFKNRVSHVPSNELKSLKNV